MEPRSVGGRRMPLIQGLDYRLTLDVDLCGWSTCKDRGVYYMGCEDQWHTGEDCPVHGYDLMVCLKHLFAEVEAYWWP
jgi:hypothetical protein